MCQNAVLETGGVYMVRVKTEASGVRANGVLEKAEATRNRTPGLHRPSTIGDGFGIRPAACAARVASHVRRGLAASSPVDLPDSLLHFVYHWSLPPILSYQRELADGARRPCGLVRLSLCQNGLFNT